MGKRCTLNEETALEPMAGGEMVASLATPRPRVPVMAVALVESG